MWESKTSTLNQITFDSMLKAETLSAELQELSFLSDSKRYSELTKQD